MNASRFNATINVILDAATWPRRLAMMTPANSNRPTTSTMAIQSGATFASSGTVAAITPAPASAPMFVRRTRFLRASDSPAVP